MKNISFLFVHLFFREKVQLLTVFTYRYSNVSCVETCTVCTVNLKFVNTKHFLFTPLSNSNSKFQIVINNSFVALYLG